MGKKKYLTYEEMIKNQGIQIEMLKKRLGSYKILGQPINRDYTNSLIDLDVQQFVSRYKWSGLPKNIPPMYIERMLYYRGSLCGFFNGGNFYILPYANGGDLNTFGYPTEVQPVAVNGEPFPIKPLTTYPNGEVNKNAKAVILHDRSPLLNSGMVVPRIVLQRDIIEYMSSILSKSEINLINAVKKLMYGVESEDQVEQTRKDIYSSINSDEPVIVAVNDGNMKNSIFNTGIELEVEKIMQLFSSINNYRCYNMGIKNNGMFEKMERIATGELTGNEYQTNLILETGLQLRKEWLENLKEIYPEYNDVLSKITVEINVEPYKNKAPNNDIEDSTYAEREGMTSKGGLNNE